MAMSYFQKNHFIILFNDEIDIREIYGIFCALNLKP